MAAAAGINKNPDVGAPSAAGPPASSLFQRRIEFHAATKPYSPASNSGGDFRLETLNPSSGSTQPVALGSAAREAAREAARKRSEGGEFFEHGLDPELGFRITFRRIGAGLANLGNTCFLNSVLQCLTYTEPFAAYLQSGKHKSSCRTAGFCALCALQNHVMIALQSTGKILSPFHLVRNLRCISRNFRNSRQEDAHEYMVNLLESMHKCCLPSGVPSESPSAYEKSLVHKIFGGRLRSQVKCTQCSYCSNKFDPFLDLSLEIVKADSLNKALGHFTAMEQLDGGEKQYQCQRCKEKVRALKQLTIHKAPYVLTIHLKRFGPDVPGQKIDRKVEFGPTLDLKPFVSDAHESDLRYTLYGVLVHAGWSTHSGHYYCFVRTSSGMWHSLDDNRVLQVSEKTVLAQKAYMLFYVRDRGTAIKRSVDAARKENIFANVPGNQVIPRSAPISNGAIHYNVLERKVTSECSSAKSKTDDSSRGQPVSVIGTSTEYLVWKEASFLQKNENNILKEAPLLQVNGHATQIDASCTQTNETILLKDSKSVPSANPLEKRPLSATLTVTEDFVKPAQLKKSNVASMSCAKDSLTPESAQIPHGKSQPGNACTGKVELGVHLNENNGPLKPTSKNHTDKLIEEINKGENGSLTNEIPQNIDIPCTVNPVCMPGKNGLAKLLSQSNHMNGFIQKEAFAKKLVENQSIGWEDDKTLRNLQCQNSVDSMQETGLGNLSKMLWTANGSVQKEALSVAETEASVANHSHAERKPKGIPKSLAKGLFFGGKHLFLMSLRLRKNKNKRSKKRYFNSKIAVRSRLLEDLNINEQATSTSEPIKIVGSDSVHSPKKRSYLSSNKGHNIGEVKDMGLCNGDVVHNNGRDTEGSAHTYVVLSTSEQPKRIFSSDLNQWNARESAVNGRGPAQNGLFSLLGSKETTVARWDDTDLPSSQIHGLGDAQNNTIGYVLDEWDEEYDRGKRKKVKQSKFSFDGPNPFQETANIRLQQKKMKVDRTISGNQPLRI